MMTKKAILLLLLAAGATHAGAQQITLMQAQPDVQITRHDLTQTPLPARHAAARPKAQALAVAPGTSWSAVEKDYDYSTGAASNRGVVSARMVTADTAVVYNLAGLPDTVAVRVDAATGTVTLKPQPLYTHPTYGPIWALSWTTGASGRLQLSTATPITGTLDAQGNVTLSRWAALVPTGDYAGYGLGVFGHSDFVATNGTMTDVLNHTGTDSVVTYPVLVEQSKENQATITNFSGNGAVVRVTLGSDRTVEVLPQRIFSNIVYGDFFCYGSDWAAGQTATGPIAGTGTDTTLTLGNWSVNMRVNKPQLARRAMSSTVRFARGAVTWPAAPTLNWSGDGSEGNPYLIATVRQMQLLAESVRLGNDYAGKHVALACDLAMDSLPLAFRPVGSASHPFNGTFDGQGHRITGLQLTESVEVDDYGLFGYAGPVSEIKNLAVDSLVLTAYGTRAGGVAGYSAGVMSHVAVTRASISQRNINGGGVVGEFCGAQLSDASFSGSITGGGNTGGVVGLLRGNASHLEAHGAVRMSTLWDDSYRGVGGLVGSTLPQGSKRATLSLSHNDARVTDDNGTGYAGGVVGSLLTGTVSQCFNMGPVHSAALMAATGSASNPVGAAGGVAGVVYGGTLRHCYNGNMVVNTQASDRVGGVLGTTINPIYTYQDDKLVNVRFTSKVTSCYNSGQVSLPNLRDTQGLYGTVYADSVLEHCYFDFQLNGNTLPQAAALRTAQFTSGTALAGMEAAVWHYAAGQYPTLQGLADNTAARLSAAPVTLSGSETTRKVKSDFAVSSAGGTVWRLYDSAGERLVTESAGLTLTGDSVKLKNANSNEVLVALAPSGDLYKMVRLATVNPGGFVGSGTQSDPYLIQDREDLVNLNRAVSTNAQDFEGDLFVQTNDIDLDYATDFRGISPDNNPARVFNGTYDGQGHAIHRLRLDSIARNSAGVPQARGSQSNAGLFGFIGPSGTVRNVVIAADCHITGWQYVGAIAGTNAGRIENCRNHAAISAVAAHAAGIAGQQAATGVITGCYNDGAITSGGNYAAGIAGYNRGAVRLCQNDGAVRADSISPYRRAGAQNYAAGIVGFNTGAAVIEDNVNTGSVHSPKVAGGIATNFYSGGTTLSRNLNYGTVTHDDNSEVSRGAISARDKFATSTLTSNYFDSQIGWYGAVASGPCQGTTGLLTRQLTSGAVPAGLDSARYVAEAGCYPVLAQFASEPTAQAARRMVLTLGDGQTLNDVQSAARLGAADTVTWTLATGAGFTVAGDTLRLAQATPGITASVRDTLVATLGACSKRLELRHMQLGAWQGSGTQADPFQIATAADMRSLAACTNDESYDFKGRWLQVMNDIDFADSAYVPVAVGSNNFNGDFNGAGHQFTSVTYDGTASTDTYVGLFGNIGPQGRVHDLTLQSGTIKAYGYAAGFAGRVFGQLVRCVNRATIGTTKNPGAAGIAATVCNGGTVSQCRNEGEVASASTHNAGIAIATQAGARVDSCENVAPITAAVAYNAGIVSLNGGTVGRSRNTGTIEGSGNLGGIVAHSLGGDSIVLCENAATVTATSTAVGGIMGAGSTSTVATVIEQCLNSGAVSANGTVGGIVGNGMKGLVLSDCSNIADVTASRGQNAGGLVGIFEAGAGYTSTMASCENSGTVTGASNNVGGLCGQFQSGAVMTGCRNSGNVLGAANYVGGLAGTFTGTVTRSSNVGNVEADGYGAGGLGGIGAGVARECFNAGSVTAHGQASSSLGNAGGLWGYAKATLQDCYNVGTVTAVTLAGGLASREYSDGVITGSYNAGTLVSANPSTASNLTSLYNGSMTLRDNYYDSDVNPALRGGIDGSATALATRQLVATAPDTAYALHPWEYPTLACFEADSVARHFAATVVLGEGDTWQSVSRPFHIGTPAGTVWTCSPNLHISGNEVSTTALGAGWITKTLGAWSKTWTLTVTAISGINPVEADAGVVRVEYFGVNGMALGTTRPAIPGIFIERATHSNGAVTTRKIVVMN